jgi:hypothetical protein
MRTKVHLFHGRRPIKPRFFSFLWLIFSFYWRCQRPGTSDLRTVQSETGRSGAAKVARQGDADVNFFYHKSGGFVIR